MGISSEETTLLDETFAAFARDLDLHHVPGFGIFPSAERTSNYFDQVWARDAAHATAHYFARAKPEAVIDSLRTFFVHQCANGAFPSRVERQYQKLRLTPGLGWLSVPAFRMIEGRWRKRNERPIYEGVDAAGGEDTIPAVLIMAGELFEAGTAKDFLKENFEKLIRATEYFRTTKTDPADNLAVLIRDNPDWADTITRKGKLSLINIWWWRGLKHMQAMAATIAEEEGTLVQTAKFYGEESDKLGTSIMEKLYDAREGFFRAEAKDDRLDTAASIFGAGYFLDAENAFLVEQTLKQRVGHASGLQNFDPPYAQKDIFWVHRWAGQWIYHNYFVWPWVALQNIHIKIKIARGHSDPAIRKQFQAEAVEDLIKIAKLFKAAGGAYEVFEPEVPVPGRTRFYHPPQNFMGSMAAYQGAYAHLKKLRWI